MLLALLPTVFAPAARGTLAGATSVQGISRLDYNQTIDANTPTGPQIITAAEIYYFEHISPSNLILTVNISASNSSYNTNMLRLSVQSDTRQIEISPDTLKYPQNKTELFLGAEESYSQISAQVHELYYLRKLNASIFTYSGQEAGEFRGATVTLRRYDTTNQYVCTS